MTIGGSIGWIEGVKFGPWPNRRTGKPFPPTAHDARGARPRYRPASRTEPPPLEVRREMLRLEMAALAADLTAEAGSLAADEAIEAIERGDEAEARADIRAEIDAVEATEALVEADDVGSSASSPAESGGAAT